MSQGVNPLEQKSSRNWCRRVHSKVDDLLSSFSGAIIGALEHAFYCYGKAIARSPFLFIFLCLLLTGFCSIGMIKFTLEERPFKLWIPEDSEFIEVMDWKERHFPSDVRFHMAIYEADNVLDKDILLHMMKVHDAVAGAQAGSASWDDLCARIPTIATVFFGRKKRDLIHESVKDLENYRRFRRQANSNEEDDFDFSLLLPRNTYCTFMESMEQECLENSLLEVFGYDSGYIESLTQEKIIEDVNLEDTSVVFGIPTNFTTYLGKVEKDGEGHIVKAGSAIHRWFTKINRTAIEDGSYVVDAGSSSQIDSASFEWEQKFIATVLNDSNRPDSLSIYLMASTSFGTVSGNNIRNDTKYLTVGFGIVFVYIMFMLGKFNLVEQRPVLSLLGLSCVGLAIGVSYGLCSAFSVPYGPVNNILPFLLLGLGVDDMFVVMQAWNNLPPRDQMKDLQERIGLTLKHAGVSITVTSVTDFVAFAIGSSTVLPALRSFCLYAAVGIASIYFFQATFFVACLSLDQRRLEDQRNGFLWCWKLKNWSPNQCSQREFCQTFFGDIYAKILLKAPVKVFVILLTASVLVVSGWGISNLRQEFSSIWFLPQDSYLYKFFMKQKEYYPSNGDDGTIYFGDINLVDNLPKIETLLSQLEENKYVAEVDSWYTKYKKYWVKQDYIVPNPNSTEEEFLDQLNQFLFSPSGSPYRERNFRFSGELNCTGRAPPVLASSIDFSHISMSTSSEKIRAMDSIRQLIKSVGFSGYVKPWSRSYAEWETDKVIVEELYRNMGLALLVVFVVTLILIASLSTSLMVLLCVLMTLVDVGALIHWWGLTIDTVSCIDLVLAIGLCVDYAAHVGHTFMTKVGTRNERATQTIETIGPAVLSGGFSTFLSFVFLSNSSSHVFITFFKIFFAVCLYGLYHGLVFLPVLLSLIGPAAYVTAHRPPTTTRVSSCTPKPQNEDKDHPKEHANNGFIERVISSGDTVGMAETKSEKPAILGLINVEDKGKNGGDKETTSMTQIDSL